MEKGPEGYNENEEPLIFHYKREDRLKTASPLVKDYYNGNFKINKGFFKVLTATRANRLLLLSIGICIAAYLMTVLFGNVENQETINGVKIELLATNIENNLFVSTHFFENEELIKSNSDEEIEVRFYCYDVKKKLIATKSVSQIYTGKDLFIRTSFQDYDILSVEAEIDYHNETKKVSTKVKKQ